MYCHAWRGFEQLVWHTPSTLVLAETRARPERGATSNRDQAIAATRWSKPALTCALEKVAGEQTRLREQQNPQLGWGFWL